LPGSRAGASPGRLGALEAAVELIHKVVIAFGSIALLLASGVLTYSVFLRYLFHAATDWQDEVAVFSIVGAVFLAGAWVQDHRGHVGIEALSSVLPPGVERIRIVVVDVMTFRVLRVLRVEVLDAVPRGLGRQDDDVVDVCAAARDSRTA
jgi:TRAP-type C4-dicarboxylate transport system permease small subunit